MTEHNCKACRFYLVTGLMEGICRQQPPGGQIVNDPTGRPVIMQVLAPAKPEGWCGQFEPTQAKLQVVES